MTDIVNTNNPKLSADITSAAEMAYSNVADRWGTHTPEVTHFKPECLSVSQFMLDFLIDNGHRVSLDSAVTWYEPEINQQGSKFYPPEHPINIQHTYLVLDDNGAELVLDATWQQFLPEDKRRPDVPKVLVGTRQQIVERAKQFGVDDAVVLNVWLTKSERRALLY